MTPLQNCYTLIELIKPHIFYPYEKKSMNNCDNNLIFKYIFHKLSWEKKVMRGW